MALQAEIEIAHFEKQCEEDVWIIWRLTDESANTVKSGEFPRLTLAIDHGIHVRRIEFSLRDLPAPTKYRLVVQIERTSLENDWEIWVYPEGHSSVQPTPGLRYADNLEQAIQLCLKCSCKAAIRLFLTLVSNKALQGVIQGMTDGEEFVSVKQAYYSLGGLQNGVLVFSLGNLVTNGAVILVVVALCRLERGYDPKLDYDGRKQVSLRDRAYDPK